MCAPAEEEAAVDNGRTEIGERLKRGRVPAVATRLGHAYAQKKKKKKVLIKVSTLRMESRYRQYVSRIWRFAR
jgi:hypothetical protein